jgi:HSP20 family protein
MARGYLTPWRGGGSLAPTGYRRGLGGSLFDLHRQMNRLFDDLFEQGGQGEGGALTGATLAAPALEVHQDDRQIEITAELPGVREEDIDLSIEDGVLTLSGEKKSERTDEERGYSERSYGRFERRMTLPSNIDEEHCAADFRDGVLRITIPKAEEKQRGRRIPLGRRSGTEQPANLNEPSRAEHQQAASEERRGGENQPS